MRSPSCARPKSCAVGARRHQPQHLDTPIARPHSGRNACTGKGLEVKGPQSSGAPPPLLTLADETPRLERSGRVDNPKTAAKLSRQEHACGARDVLGPRAG